MPAFVLIVLYIVIALAPLAIAWAAGLPPRPLLDDLSSGLAMVAFAALLIEFVLSGRFRTVSGGIGIDLTMRFHQLFARTILVLVLIHPFIYTLPIPAYAPPWDPTAAETLRLDGPTFMTGGVAWVLLATLVITGVARDALPYSYELWRFGHGMGAVLVAGLTAHHALGAGRYAQSDEMVIFWAVLLAIAGATMVHVYLISPIRKLLCPFRVISSKQIAERTWELAFARADGEPFEFEAGQFIWISLRKGPFTLAENPFSIASAPSNGVCVELIIKEVGDFSRSLGGVEAGQPAWVDGPHGSLKLPGPELPGIGLIAGGVGLAPLLSILREMQATGDPRPVVLLYGNRLESQIVYREELERMAEAEQVSVSHVLSEPPAGWAGLQGMIGPETIEAAFGTQDGARDWTYLMCGPPGMLDVAEDALIARGVDPGRILSERFVYD